MPNRISSSVCAAVLLSLFASSPALAQANGQPVKLETASGTVSGVLVDRLPAGYLVRADDGQTTVVPYAEVRSIGDASAAPAPVPAAAREPVAAASNASPALVPPQPAADDSEVEPEEPVRPRRRHLDSLTFSPFHVLLLPMFELTNEVRVANRFGIAGILGLGAIDDVLLVEYGGQLRAYPVGSFDHGMNLGMELMGTSATNGYASAEGYSAAAFLGYKYSASVGFTIEVQVGAQGIFSDFAETQYGPMLNFGIGWSFGTLRPE